MPFHISGDGKTDRAGEGDFRPAAGTKYILMVGTLEPRKNYPRAIQAFAIFRNQGFTDWQLMIAGGSGWAYDDIDREIDRLGLRDVVNVMGQVPSPTLSALYRDAGALFYPSLYEGFGFPILEAMAAGCPVVTSNRSSMAEVGDGAVQLVDPLDAQSMAAGLAAVLGDAARRAELVAKGRDRARDFSWDRFALQSSTPSRPRSSRCAREDRNRRPHDRGAGNRK
jgi:glycosyltransferase involved in cell wall biosynthesis